MKSPDAELFYTGLSWNQLSPCHALGKKKKGKKKKKGGGKKERKLMALLIYPMQIWQKKRNSVLEWTYTEVFARKERRGKGGKGHLCCLPDCGCVGVWREKGKKKKKRCRKLLKSTLWLEANGQKWNKKLHTREKGVKKRGETLDRSH